MALAYSQLTDSGRRSRRRRTKAQMGNALWRLEHLYYVVNEDGKVVKFTLRPVIRKLLKNLHWRNIILKARQLGWTTFLAILFLDTCVFTNDVRAGIVAHKLEAAQVIFRDKILYAYDHLPKTIREHVKATKRDGGELLLSNNSGIRVDTSMRSGTLQLVHISEYGPMVAHYPDKAREVKTGTLETAHDEAMIFIESTAEGASGDFFDLWQTAVKHDGPLSRHDYRAHFFAWYEHPEYVLDPRFVRFSDADALYFAAIEQEAGTTLSPEQRAWYVKKRENLGVDMLKEYPSLPREAFQASSFSIFDPVVLDAMQAQCKSPIARVQFVEINGEIEPQPSERILSAWRIWVWPKRTHQYVLYGDVMEGLLSDPDQPQKGHDFHYAGIMDRNTHELVATYRSQQDTIPYGQQLVLAARYFLNAWASPEVNSCGLAVLNEFKRANYPRIFSRQTAEETDAEQISDKLGVKVGPLNRKPLLEMLRNVLCEQQLYIYDEDLVSELRSFVNKDGRWEAARGANDDGVMMLAGLVYIHQESPFGPTTILQGDSCDRPYSQPQHAMSASVAGGVAYDPDTWLDGEEERT